MDPNIYALIQKLLFPFLTLLLLDTRWLMSHAHIYLQ